MRITLWNERLWLLSTMTSLRGSTYECSTMTPTPPPMKLATTRGSLSCIHTTRVARKMPVSLSRSRATISTERTSGRLSQGYLRQLAIDTSRHVCLRRGRKRDSERA